MRLVSVTSAAYTSTLAPRCRSSPATRASSSPRRASKPNCAEPFAYSRASASPMPLLAPVMKTLMIATLVVGAPDCEPGNVDRPDARVEPRFDVDAEPARANVDGADSQPGGVVVFDIEAHDGDVNQRRRGERP